MSTFSLNTIQKIPVDLEMAWAFFSNPTNLQTITPENLDFKVISKLYGDKIYPGQIIEYTLRPLLGIPVYWMTEITHLQDRQFFVDEQRIGPYQLWHHQHHFKAIDGGVEMMDIVHYRNPFGFLGNIANTLFVKKQLNTIFNYRFNRVEEMFGKWK
jgi:ligand-binding SRPBCC domain-containing protein